MSRTTSTPTTRARRKKVIKQAEGYFGSKHKLFKTAKEQLMNAWEDSYNHRKKRVGDFRRLWIIRLNNACRELGLSYSRFIRLKALAQIKLNRKQLTEMAVQEPEQFKNLVEKIKNPWDN